MPDDVRAWAATHIGYVRAKNEDRCGTSRWRSTGQDETWSGEIDRTCGWALIADGMGGHGAGEVASGVALQALADLLPGIPDTPGLEPAIERANERVHAAMFVPGGRPAMGTTIVGLLMSARECTFFNVGDSRGYLLRDGRLEMVSRDHVPEVGGARGGRSHAVTQSLGGTYDRRRLKPHLSSTTLGRGDVVLLCSDGLTDLVDDGHIAALLRSGSDRPATDLVEAALAAGGRDNVSVIVLAF
ncbi:PP2C family protein-serine/threonine phosphatase [Lichenibacterium dinghuense]|uniref:PP2C family protein-serine/threonine phosphatase n=1 Tax=Lichenibacterium dinghuense TaxID=2895977 RepID=UPI001F468202|nr:protein phosphatase 2C domain-containing protein [Lichenibacterium sp. 6Y81]